MTECRYNMPMGTFSERLKALRESRGLTPNAVHKYAGVPRSTYVDWENGANAKLADALVGLADYYGTTVDFIVGRVDDPERPVRLLKDDKSAYLALPHYLNEIEEALEGVSEDGKAQAIQHVRLVAESDKSRQQDSRYNTYLLDIIEAGGGEEAVEELLAALRESPSADLARARLLRWFRNRFPDE